MPMKKRPRALAGGTGKRRKGSARRRKPPSSRSSTIPVTADRARATLRGLRDELARALKRIGDLQASAETDFLLGIPNRRGFERELNRAIAYIKRYDASGALIVLDVDRLKPINDAFGHAAGDQVLKAIAGVLTSLIRASDVVGRLGGDEFALLLWNLSETDARAKAAALEEAVDRLTFEFGGHSVRTGVSAGVAILDVHAQ